MTERYLISIATYRRIDGLRRLLDSLAASIDRMVADIIVVDNDPDGSARETASLHKLEPIYLLEPSPGIAAARNRGLKRFSDDYEAVIFVDDDEWVEPDWFDMLTGYARAAVVDIVQGPIVAVLPDDAPRAIRSGGFYDRPPIPTGTRLNAAATNNTLMRRAAWAKAGYPLFDAAFSATGGSDTDLFWGIRKAGASIVFCAEAVVSEEVPQSRLTFRWLRQRFLRTGMVDIRVRRKHQDSIAGAMLKAPLTLIWSSAALAWQITTTRRMTRHPYYAFYTALGKLAAIAGKSIEEYRRN